MKKIMFILLLLSPLLSLATDVILIKSVIDGDTLKAIIPNLPPSLSQVSIRVNGIDTPELHGKCAKEKALANEAKTFLNNWFLATKNVKLDDLDWDKFGGRILATVYFDSVLVATTMIEKGYAVGYSGEKKVKDWCQ